MRRHLYHLIAEHAGLRRSAAAVLCVAIMVAMSICVRSAQAAGPAKPSASQLARLSELDAYIDYFTGLEYGSAGSKVSPVYLRALIITESSAKKWAHSYKGARGLTQIMPETGRMAAREIVARGVDYRYVDESRLASFQPEYLYDPAINILIACHLSATYSTRYGGRTDLIASAWNAGPNAVARYGNRPPPYPETRKLLARVHDYMTYFQNGHTPKWAVQRWDTHGFDAPGWELDYDAPGWNIGWKRPTNKRRSY